jgi:cysteine synthase
MRAEGTRGSIVTILCDSGERYSHSYYNPQWYASCKIDVANADAELNGVLAGGAMGEVRSQWRD